MKSKAKKLRSKATMNFKSALKILKRNLPQCQDEQKEKLHSKGHWQRLNVNWHHALLKDRLSIYLMMKNCFLDIGRHGYQRERPKNLIIRFSLQYLKMVVKTTAENPFIRKMKTAN